MTRLSALLVALSFFTPQTFRSGTEAVRVDVLATRDRTPVAGLTAADFEVRDNGVVQTIDAVAMGDVPLSVVLGFDVSASVRGRGLESLRTALTAAMHALGADDRIALLSFSHALALRAPFNSPGERALDAIRSLEASGGTSVHDAAFAALMMKDTRPGRPVVLLLSDGDDTASWLGEEAVLAAARRTDAVVYGVAAPFTPDALDARLDSASHLPLMKPEVSDQPFLVHLAEETGGRVFYAEKTEDTQRRLVDALRELKSRYLLTYTPHGVDTAGWHQIEVKVGRAGVKVTARRGYQR